MKIWEHPLVFVAAGVGLLVLGAYMRVQSLRSRSWPVVSGVITESQLLYGSRTRSGGGRDASARITYRYAVNGKVYNGNLLSYAPDFLDDAAAQVSRYPLGSAVDVHYDLKDPATAVLDPGTGPTPGLALLAGLGCFGYAFWRARLA